MFYPVRCQAGSEIIESHDAILYTNKLENYTKKYRFQPLHEHSYNWCGDRERMAYVVITSVVTRNVMHA